MIGLYGIVANEDALDRDLREDAFRRMSLSVDKNDFHNVIFRGAGFSVGVTLRNIGENRDLSIKAFGNNSIIGFCGYGKFRGEKRLYWADTMLDRVAEAFRKKGEEALTLVEGSFQCLILRDTEFQIVSDRFSSKNLFHYSGDECFVFAPDVGRVVKSGLVPKVKNLDAAKQVLVSGFFLDDSTLAKGVMRFPYGSLLKGHVSRKIDTEMRRYWEVSEKEGMVDEITPDLVSEFNGKMKRTVYELADLEERAIVPLSGGLDSRAIACYVSKRKHLDTLTYDLGDEVSISRKVCKTLKGSQSYFSNDMIQTEDFKNALELMIENQRIHAVLNQYFYAPLFKKYFNEHIDKAALFDGVYMDILFSAPYTYYRFNADDFLRVYGRGAGIASSYCNANLEDLDLLRPAQEAYLRIERELKPADGVGKSQKAYLNGRLRRYVLEFLSFKENYCYVFKPGFDYDLVDFGYSLSLRLRRGLLYQELFKTFPNVANIPFKDSYGIRRKTLSEKLKVKYVNLRLKLSYGSNGFLPYYPYQTEWFFLGLGQIDNYRGMLLKPNCITELFDGEDLERLFGLVKRKHYLFNLFQRVLFLQQFYRRYEF
jgi:hypothetical protein